ncbi:MAG: flavodoxin-dependent (E)-4-hydroxy-3-methylbut-2-enyl-diphosphate synthase [Candidatus Aminicenantes bacterium]|nr:flavodoxin-dependent (E)-4-hydroxy-3-methylbut-2-enyl-diphosphate synthase [Candidatus Aminicenantes bacterium]
MPLKKPKTGERKTKKHQRLEEPCYPIVRRKTKQIRIGNVKIGGGVPIVVQSMAKTDTRDRTATLAQLRKMEKAGCEIARLAVPDEEAVEAFGIMKKEVSVPLIADVHFDHRLALASLEKGADGLRINPGNIGSTAKIQKVARAAKERSVPIRIGVNSGSLEKDLLRKYGSATPEAMVESALRHVKILEDLDFTQIKISLKASDVMRTLKAYQLLAEKVDYPFHAGITESGTLIRGTVKSSVGLALLLREGLADTIRVSLTAPPEEEVRVGFLILSSLGLRRLGPNVIICPVCGRCEVDLFRIASQIEKRLASIRTSLDVAVMGCMVNGPGEAKEADIGLACGRGVGVIFKRGQLLRRVEEEQIVPEFVKEVKALEKKTCRK